MASAPADGRTSLKRVLIGAALLAACLLGGLWLFLQRVPPSTSLNSFQQVCVQGQRRLVSGDVRRLDDETEGRLLAYCDCVAREVGSRLSQQDVAAIGLDRADPALEARLEGIFTLCRTQHP